MPDSHIALREAAAGYGDRLVFEGLTLEIPAGQVTALCGPNGCGKSSALKAMRRLLPPRHGAALLGDRPVTERSARTLAREIAMLGQTPEAPGNLTVRDLAGLGHYAHASRLTGPGPADRAALDAALSAVDLSDLADRPIAALSGGQLQRAWLAMTVAQEAPAILLDEPTNHLDITHAPRRSTLCAASLMRWAGPWWWCCMISILLRVSRTGWCSSKMAPSSGRAPSRRCSGPS